MDGRVRGRLAWGLQALAFLGLFAALGILVVAVLVPRVAGGTPYTILTGSMQPERPAGTLVVVRPVDAADLAVGDVITYQLVSGEPTVVTHRIVGVGSTVSGEPRFQTQGDANDTPDVELVQPLQVRGKLWYSVPFLGYASNFLTGHQRQLGIYLVAGLLAAYALRMWQSALRDRRRRTAESLRGRHAAEKVDTKETEEVSAREHAST